MEKLTETGKDKVGLGRVSNEGKTYPRDEEVRKNHPGAVGGRRSDDAQPGLSSDTDSLEDVDFGRKDPQQIADENIQQYTTGKPI